jgi:hypothetical protein
MTESNQIKLSGALPLYLLPAPPGPGVIVFVSDNSNFLIENFEARVPAPRAPIKKPPTKF